MLIFIILIACILPLIYFELKTHKINEIIKHTSGPKSVPLIGNAHQVGKTPSGKLLLYFVLIRKNLN